MFLPYKITLAEIESLCKVNSITSFDLKKEQNKSFSLLKEYIRGKDDIIDGSKLQSIWFPTDNKSFMYDIFISHSHEDSESAQLLASWLEKSCGLRCFLDAAVWQSADLLLKEIDEDYCIEKNTKNYNYQKRNFSTSHVHAMLTMAIMDIMDRTECSIFIKSSQSIKLEEAINTKTLSPWLYLELSFMKKLRIQIPERYKVHKTRMYSSGDQTIMTESEGSKLNFAYSVDLSSIHDLTSYKLLELKKKKLEGNSCLDELYKSSYLK